MNYLAHIALAGGDAQHQVGGLLGDFIRGPLVGQFSPRIEDGIKENIVNWTPMSISNRNLKPFYNALTAQCAAMPASLPIFFMTIYWPPNGTDIIVSHSNIFVDFYQHLAIYHQQLPPKAQKEFSAARTADRLARKLQQQDGLPLILQRIGQRCPVALQEALPVVEQHSAAIADEFHQLYPRLQVFMRHSLHQIELH